MRVLLTFAVLIGALWIFDAYEYDGYCRYALLHQFEQTVDYFGRSVNNTMTGRGGR